MARMIWQSRKPLLEISPKTTINLFVLATLLVSIPFTIRISEQSQHLQQHAAQNDSTLIIKNTVSQVIPVGISPIGITRNPVTHMLYVANFGSNTVSVIDERQKKVVGTIPVTGNPYYLAINPRTNLLYVTEYNANTVTIIDTKNNTVVDSIPVGKNPVGIVADQRLNMLYVSNEGDDNVTFIDAASKKVTTTLAVGKNPLNMYLAANGMLYVANSNSNTISVIDPIRDSITTTVDLHGSPRGICSDDSNNHIFITDTTNGTIDMLESSQLNNASDILFSSTATEPNSASCAVDPINHSVYVANDSPTDDISFISAKGVRTATLQAGKGPRDMVFDPQTNELYVTNFYSNAISLLSGEKE